MSMPRDERLPASRVLSHLVVMLAVAAVLGVVVAGLAIPFAGVLGVGARNVARTMDQLPAELETGDLAQTTTILDANGKVLTHLFVENRTVVPLSKISRNMTKSIVAIEDYRFYQHGALDLKGTLRALVTNQANSGKVQGGSSITQQLVKLTLIDQAKTKAEQRAASDDTYARKLKELRYAIALEQRHTKDWILERYLNTAYFGDGAYGIQAAAQHYFGVDAKRLKVSQAALLAGLVKNPNGYDPINYPDRAIERRDVVVDRMAQLNVITHERADAIKEKGLGLKVHDLNNNCLDSSAPFFCDYAVNWLLKDEQFGRTEKARLRFLKTSGLTIKTTLDPRDQSAADNAVQAHVYRNDPAIGALAMIQPGTGNVRAVAQSRPMGGDFKDGYTYLNYAVPEQYGDAAGFQAGSTFKAFTLATALEQGLSLNTVFNSPSPMTFNFQDFSSCPGYPGFGYGTFDVPNSTTTGLKNMYSGTRESVNTYFMQLEEETGVCEPFRLAKKLGVELDNPLGDKRGNGAEISANFTLGVDNASPLEMAEAYATFAARGLHCSARPVTEVLDTAGGIVKKYPENCTQVLQQSTADAVNDVLRGVIEGGFASAQALSVPAAGKTGTTNSQYSVWFNGYTTSMATAAVIAGVTPDGTPDSLQYKTVGGQYIASASGSGNAAYIWGDAMKAIQDQFPYENFVYPSTTEGAGITVVSTPKPPKNNGGGRGGRGGGGRGGR